MICEGNGRHRGGKGWKREERGDKLRKWVSSGGNGPIVSKHIEKESIGSQFRHGHHTDCAIVQCVH